MKVINVSEMLVGFNVSGMLFVWDGSMVVNYQDLSWFVRLIGQCGWCGFVLDNFVCFCSMFVVVCGCDGEFMMFVVDVGRYYCGVVCVVDGVVRFGDGFEGGSYYVNDRCL